MKICRNFYQVCFVPADVGSFYPNLGAHAFCGSQEHIYRSFYKTNLSWGIKLQQLKFGHLSEEQFGSVSVETEALVFVEKYS